MEDAIYYNYDRIISYDALLYMLIGERGVGKTYGASKLVVKEFIKKKRQFVYLRRYKTELSKSSKKFFSIIPNVSSTSLPKISIASSDVSSASA